MIRGCLQWEAIKFWCNCWEMVPLPSVSNSFKFWARSSALNLRSPRSFSAFNWCCTRSYSALNPCPDRSVSSFIWSAKGFRSMLNESWVLSIKPLWLQIIWPSLDILLLPLCLFLIDCFLFSSTFKSLTEVFEMHLADYWAPFWEHLYGPIYGLNHHRKREFKGFWWAPETVAGGGAS